MSAIGTGPSASARAEARAGAPVSPALTAVRALEASVTDATREAALACWPWVGRGQAHAADAAATEAMRAALARAPGKGVVVTGEGEKDEAPMLFTGERVGSGDGPDFELAVDPLECTDFCAAGLAGALATIAVAEPGALWSPGPAFYMDKIVVSAPARAAIDIRDEPEVNLERVAAALGRRVEELRVVILDKPRHEALIGRLRELGAAVSTPADGDVAGALAALLPAGEADVLMGIGGTPEGVMTACAARALGGGMEGRLAPQRDDESVALADAGVDIERRLTLDDLVRGEALFAATGVTGGSLLRGPWDTDDATWTESIVISPPGAARRVVEARDKRYVPKAPAPERRGTKS